MGGDGDPIELLFVYGTLQPGHLRWPFLEPYAVTHRPAEVSGTIYDTGYGWPVAAFGPADSSVPGTLVALDRTRLAEALDVLDDVEATATDLLRRVAITTTGGERAWTYHCDRPTGLRIARWGGADER